MTKYPSNRLAGLWLIFISLFISTSIQRVDLQDKDREHEAVEVHVEAACPELELSGVLNG